MYHRPLLCGEFSSQETVGQFDLYYYDGLARQEEVIRLTVSEYPWGYMRAWPHEMGERAIFG